MANIELLQRLRRQLVGHPESHDQGEWGNRSACGTQACAAGWTLVLTGNARWREYGDGRYALHANTESGSVPDAAGDLLDIDLVEREYLFYHAQDQLETLAVIDTLIDGGNVIDLVDEDDNFIPFS
jgi:hypothetical protein